MHISVACPPFPDTQPLLHLFLKHSEIHTVLVSRSANHDSLFEMGIKQKIGGFNFLMYLCSIHSSFTYHSPPRAIFDFTCSYVMLKLPTAGQIAVSKQ